MRINLIYILLLFCLNLLAYNPDLGTDTIYICPDDSVTDITPIVKGGGKPWIFSWDNGSTSKDRYMVKPGDYDLSIWDRHDCGYVKYYKVIKLANIYVEYSSTSPTCKFYSDGSFWFIVNGGKPPYNYYLNGTKIYSTLIQSLTSGDYDLRIVDCNGCVYDTTVIINKANDKPFNQLVIDSKCNEVYVNVYGEYEPYKLELNGYNLYDNKIIVRKDTIYDLHVIGSNGCTYDTLLPIRDIVEFSIDDIIIKQPNCKLINDGMIHIIENDNVKYEWAHNFIDTNKLDNLKPGEYYVTITNLDNLCKIEEIFELKYRNNLCVKIPNAFSPNRDGINETWDIENLNILYPNCKVWIYNRWGQLVYKSVGYNKPWDGKNKGYNVPIDTYHYIIEIEGEKPIMGQITLLK